MKYGLIATIPALALVLVVFGLAIGFGVGPAEAIEQALPIIAGATILGGLLIAVDGQESYQRRLARGRRARLNER